ncbi:MAG TPA: alpha/beta hydrolase [Thermoleophilaceae bacterium]|nr:alpha/beta hydrolase [Thermoleophilaceae bacterium]
MRSTGEPGWDRRREFAGLETFWREAPAAGDPVLYLHGAPTNSDDFLPFLERTGGVAPDLPGFGRSAKPADFDYSITGYARFLEAFVRELGMDRFSLVVHDWGAVGLALPDELLARLERVVIVNAVPLLPAYRWHRIARLWRTPVVGELTMGFTTRWGLRQLSRAALVADGPAPDDLIDRVWDHFDHGTQRAILKLYRSAPPEELVRAGGRLAAIRAPALVVWGERDPYIPAVFARSYAGTLGGRAQVELVEDAGHWPWLDRPDAADLVCRFLSGGSEVTGAGRG